MNQNMKLEICDNTFWLAPWSVIAGALVIIILGATYFYNARINTIVAAGYQEVMADSSRIPVWQKK